MRKKKENRRRTNKMKYVPTIAEKKRGKNRKIARPETDDLLHVRVPVEFLALLALEAMPMSRFPPTNANISKISTEGSFISYRCSSTILSKLEMLLRLCFVSFGFLQLLFLR